MFLLREQERYLLRIQELEIAVARLGEESIDKATLLETAQSDKETISRSALKLLGPLHFLRFYRQKWPKSKWDKISRF